MNERPWNLHDAEMLEKSFFTLVDIEGLLERILAALEAAQPTQPRCGCGALFCSVKDKAQPTPTVDVVAQNKITHRNKQAAIDRLEARWQESYAGTV